jgi:chromosome segregation protein
VAQADAERLLSELAEARAQADIARQALAERQAERDEAEQAAQAARQELAKLNDRQVQLQARLAEREAQVERLLGSQEAALQAEAVAQDALQAAQAASQVAQRDLERARQESQAAAQLAQSRREQIEKLSAEQKQLQEQHATARADLARLTAQADVLQQAESELAGYAQGAQLLLKASRESRLQASPSALSNQIEAPAELETAIAAALGEYLDSVILESTSRLDAALDLLAGQSARGVLLPLDSLAPQPARLGDLLSLPGVLGLASEMIQCPAALRPALDVLLGSTLVVNDRPAARRLLSSAATAESASLRLASLRAVTLAGEVFHASGQVVAGQEGKLSTLSRARQLRELRDRLTRMQAGFERLEGQLAGVADRVASAQAEFSQAEQALQAARREEEGAEKAHRGSLAALEKAGREVSWLAEQRERFQNEIESSRGETARLKQEQVEIEAQITAAREQLRLRSQSLAELPLDELGAQVNHWNTLAAVAERAAGDARTRQAEREAALQAARSLLTSVQTRLGESSQALVDLEEEKTGQRQVETELSEQIAELRLLIDPAEAELDSSEASQETLQTSETSARQALSKAEHNHAQARIALARRQEVLETWRRRIEDDFGLVAFEYAEEISGPTPLPLDGLVEQLPRVEKLSPDVEDSVRRQRAQLRRMGPVNPEAQAEYHEVRDRYRFMTEQVADLEKAETDVRQVIAELDALMQGELRKTFDAVSAEFSAIFKRLFDGGSARLLLTDPEDMTNTGIDIEARLPGRRTQGLSLLSGGERSLTAVSLVFALLRVSPTPFCVLDEVDAMLDEANVGRFREMLRELSQHTQFVIVTHNRNTVQVADAIYGVTMGRDSSSQVISLRLDEVSTIVE